MFKCFFGNYILIGILSHSNVNHLAPIKVKRRALNDEHTATIRRMRAAGVVAALLALVASASSREELSADKAVEAAAPPSVCGEQCQNKYDVKVRERPLSSCSRGDHFVRLSWCGSDGAHLCCLSRLIISGRLMFFRAKKLCRNRGCIIFSSTSSLLWTSSLA